MKKLKKSAYIALIVIIVVLSLTIYTNASKENSESEKEKVFAEIKFIEIKLENMLNTMNNIETRNYSLVTSKLSKQSTEKSSSGSDNQSESGGTSSGGDSKGESQGSEKNNQDSQKQDEQESKKFELKAGGVLTSKEDINWDNIKNEIENIYTSIPGITLDLYGENINQEDILGFNSEFDNLTKIVKDENKKETMQEITKVYDYLPKFLKQSKQEQLYVTGVETKSNIFKAYSKLDIKDWQGIGNDVKNAIDVYSKLLSSTEIDSNKQYNISKVYVMLNELQNAVNIQDESVFLIKYKNLLEEMI